MAIKKHKPTTPGRRFATWSDRAEVTRTAPEKSLVEGLGKSGGRNVHGRVTSRHRGGGAKRRYRKIDFKRRKDGVPAKVAAIEYDPNRSAHIALLHYADGEKRYILAPARLRVGATVVSGDRADIQVGNSLPLRAIPTGTTVHNVELTPGRARHRGKRPQTRGVAMNPVDHPHGGGEAHHTPGGHPVTPWGVPTLGYRTRKKRKGSDKLIVRGRRRGKKGKR